MTERELIKKAKNGDAEAFGKLIRPCERLIYNAVLRLVKNREDAFDISQEAFIKAYKGIRKFDEKAEFSTWLYRIAINAAIDETRKKASKEVLTLDDNESDKRQNAVSPEKTPEEKLMQKELRDDIISALDKLSPQHRQLIILRDLNGLNYADIAYITNSPLGTVKSRLARARFNLRDILLEKLNQ